LAGISNKKIGGFGEMEIVREKIVEQCKGCQKVAGECCGIFPVPVAKWRDKKTCNMATHIKAAPAEKGKVNPLKASKRAANNK
jgi:hypothetical protein